MKCLFVLLLAVPATLLWVSADARLPVTLVWQFYGGDHVRCLSAIEDMDGDGVPDVLAEFYHSGCIGDHFKLLGGGDGVPIWQVTPIGGVSNGSGYGDMCVNTSPDLNGDGLEEALLGTAWGGRSAYAILADEGGTVSWCFDTYVHDPPSGWVYSLDWIPDVSGDGVPEIVFGCGSGNNNAYCVDGATGLMRWRFPAPDAVYSVAGIGDVNGNGFSDVLVGTGDNSHYAYCVDGGSSGTAPYIWRFNIGDTSYSVDAIPDVTGDGIDDALVGSWDSAGNVYCLDGTTGTPFWSHPIGSYTPVMRVIPIGDLNDDGIMEVLVGSWDNAIICLDGATGNEYWNVPTGTTNGGDVWTIWPLGDVDYDSYPDVIAGSFDLKAYCVSGKTGALLWDYTVGNRVYSVRGISDVNGDGIDEALVGTQYMSGGGRVFCLDADGDGTAVPPLCEVACTVVDGGVELSWSFDEGLGIAGFNVYRKQIGEPASPAAFRHSLAEQGIDSVSELLSTRGAAGRGSGFLKLNEDLVSGASYMDRSAADGVRYIYMIGAVLRDGSEMFGEPVEILVDLCTSRLWLAAPSPNPFAGGTTIEFGAPPGSTLSLGIYDTAGRLVRELKSGPADQGRGTAFWDGRDSRGAPVASGIYFAALRSGPDAATRTVALVR